MKAEGGGMKGSETLCKTSRSFIFNKLPYSVDSLGPCRQRGGLFLTKKKGNCGRDGEEDGDY